MTQKFSNINEVWGHLIIEELIRNEASYFCISPGSRSTPLTMAVARNPKSRYIIHFDERGAAFYALGYARATNKKVVLICTSGTAVANYFPALIEAYFESIPLIVLSADRPPELKGTGANQTIDQSGIFGKYVRYFFDLPCPDQKTDPVFVLSEVDRMMRYTSDGPVHLNCMFREPLAPLPAELNKKYPDAVKNWFDSDLPYKRIYKSQPIVNKHDILRFTEHIENSHNVLVIVGRLKNEQEKKSVSEFINKINHPVFTDILSGIKTNYKDENIINYYDHILLRNWFKPDFILHIGGRITSKRLLNMLKSWSVNNYYYVTSDNMPYDPMRVVRTKIYCDLVHLLDQFNYNPAKIRNSALKKELKNYDIRIHKLLDAQNDLSEINISRKISALIPENHALFLASSMPVRDMDMFACFEYSRTWVASNRGVSGIDGTIASAIGYSNALNKPVTLIIGDLAFLHDMNSLYLLKKLQNPMIIVVINNHGGGIFSFLPVAEFKNEFEEFFATTHEHSFESITYVFDLKYSRPEKISELETNLKEAFKLNQSVLIEVVTDRDENYKVHREIEHKIISMITGDD